MNTKGGLLANAIILIAVFLVGTFFGWGILANFFGEEAVERLSPEPEISGEALIKLCSEESIKEVVCSVLVEDFDITNLGFDEENGTESENEQNESEA